MTVFPNLLPYKRRIMKIGGPIAFAICAFGEIELIRYPRLAAFKVAKIITTTKMM